MMDTVEATFVIDDWAGAEVDSAPGHDMSTAVVRKTFSGAVQGTSVAHLVLVHTPVEGSMAYVGLERLKVEVDGRRGSFVLLHSAVSVKGEVVGRWEIVEGSGTEDLEGITGIADIDNSGDLHRFTLDCTLP